MGSIDLRRSRDRCRPWPPPRRLREKIEALADARVAEDATQIVALARRAERWRRLAIAASALAACLLMTIGVREFWRPPVGQDLRCRISEGRRLTGLRAYGGSSHPHVVGAAGGGRAAPGKSYQLWMASEKFGAAPRSLGLIDAQASAPQRSLPTTTPRSSSGRRSASAWSRRAARRLGARRARPFTPN